MVVTAIAAPAVREVESSTDYGKFEIEPLEPGFGTTRGNSLRRVLLSSLNGAAITSVSIDGVAHEFSAIPHVKEDVTEILLNIKEINVISHSDEPVRITLDVTGPRDVTAGDITVSSDVEVRNPGVHICTPDGPPRRPHLPLGRPPAAPARAPPRGARQGLRPRGPKKGGGPADRGHPHRRHL